MVPHYDLKMNTNYKNKVYKEVKPDIDNMKEIKFIITKQENGWYLASPDHNRIGGATEAPDLKTLKNKIKEFTSLSLSNGFYKELGLSRSSKIRLIYSELLFENPEAEKILVQAAFFNNCYIASSNSCMNLNEKYNDFEALKEDLLKKIRELGHDDKHVELRLEEVL